MTATTVESNGQKRRTKKDIVGDRKNKPCTPIFLENIPDELTKRTQIVLWGWDWDPKREEWSKPPKQLNTLGASHSDPATWCTYDQAFAAVVSGRFDGPGFVFTAGDHYVGFDLDGDCRDPDTGEIDEWAQEIIDRIDSYTEISPSGTGVKIICKGELPGGGKNQNGREMHDDKRYFALTGNVLDGRTEIQDRSDLVLDLYREWYGEADGSDDPPEEGETTCPLTDDELVAKIKAGAINPRTHDLFVGAKAAYEAYGHDDSKLDLALADRLYQLVGPCRERIEDLFGQSALGQRDKWQGREDYRRMTIDKALKSSGPLYDWTPAAQVFANVGIPTIAEREGRTDLANARRLNTIYGDSLRYNHEWKRWMFWDGARWADDCDGSAVRLASAIADKLLNEAKNARDPKAFNFACASASAKGITNMLKLAQSLAPVAVSELDTNPYLLNCQNGTVDLRTARLREHRREDYITRLCPLDYDAAANAPVFTNVFLPSVFAGNEDAIPYLLRLIGYAAIGVTTEQILAIAWGDGSNGKSTLFESIMHALGPDYAGPAPRELLMVSKRSEHPTEIADLCGKRLVLASETDDGRRLAEAQVKYLTGSDTLKARRMHENFWSFPPTHTLFLCTNHRPEVVGTDHAIWRRLRLIPFENRFDGDAKDTGMPAKLEAEAQGILRWIVEGAAAWVQDGLQEPRCVRTATDSYRSDEDVIGRFIRDRCTEGTDLTVKFSDLKSALRDWCFTEGTAEPSVRKLSGYLKASGFRSYTNNGTYYNGVELKQAACQGFNGTN